MTINEFKKIARTLKIVYLELEKEALEAGIDLLSPEYAELVDKARLALLVKHGFTLEKYREVKEQVTGIDKVGTLAVMQDTQKKLREIDDRHIPTSEEIEEIAEQVAQKYIVPPQIINKIVDRVTIKEPKIIKETIKIKERVEYNDKPIRKELARALQQIDEIKIPKPIDVEALRKNLTSEFQELLDHNINTLNMPNFRKLAMGLQAQIDALGSGGGTPASPDTSVQFNDGGSFGGAKILYTEGDTAANLIASGENMGEESAYGIRFVGADGVTSNFSGGSLSFQSGSGTAGDANGGNITFQTGDGLGSEGSGSFNLQTGASGETGDGGTINMAAGTGGATSGSGGSISLTAGSAQGGDSDGGNLTFIAGNATGINNGGLVTITAGNAGDTGIGGALNITAGSGGSTSGSGGPINISAGNAFGSDNGGTVTIVGGNGSGDGNGGNLILKGGAKSGSAGHGTVQILGATLDFAAVLDASLIASANKTFTFLNNTGTLNITTGHARATAQTAANTNILTVAVGDADATFELLINVLVTTATAHSFSVTVDYTDESNVARTATIPVAQLAGTFVTLITNVTGAGPYEGTGLTIRAKAGTNIVFKTAGTFTNVVYNVDCSVVQIN